MSTELRKDLEQVIPKLKPEDCIDEAKVLAALEQSLPERKGDYTTDQVLEAIKDLKPYQIDRIRRIANELGSALEFNDDDITFWKFNIQGRKTYSEALEASQWRDKSDASLRQLIRQLQQRP